MKFSLNLPKRMQCPCDSRIFAYILFTKAFRFKSCFSKIANFHSQRILKQQRRLRCACIYPPLRASGRRLYKLQRRGGLFNFGKRRLAMPRKTIDNDIVLTLSFIVSIVMNSFNREDVRNHKPSCICRLLKKKSKIPLSRFKASI